MKKSYYINLVWLLGFINMFKYISGELSLRIILLMLDGLKGQFRREFDMIISYSRNAYISNIICLSLKENHLTLKTQPYRKRQGEELT